MEIRELKEISRGHRAAYLRFSHFPVCNTKSFANGHVVVDIDHCNEVVGIELLGAEAGDLEALARVAREYKLSFDALIYAQK